MKILVEEKSEAELQKLGVRSWPIWTKEISRFDWHYDECERCLILEGDITVETSGGEKVSFGEGDFVTFPQGLSCVWNVHAPVRKHYKFG